MKIFNLSKSSTPPNLGLNSRNGNALAFTLAEVLITLGIIGIVAAMTIPNLINSFQKNMTVEKLKSVYSVMENAEKLSEIDNGPSSTWDYTLSGYDFMTQYYEPYLKIAAKGTSDIAVVKKTIKYTNMNGDSFNLIDGGFNYVAILTNGVIFSVAKTPQFIIIRADLNGLSAPNKLGRDVFDFEAMWDGPKRLTTSSRKLESYSRTTSTISYCRNHTYTGGTPSWCAALIQHDGWKIADDYPWN